MLTKFKIRYFNRVRLNSIWRFKSLGWRLLKNTFINQLLLYCNIPKYKVILLIMLQYVFKSSVVDLIFIVFIMLYDIIYIVINHSPGNASSGRDDGENNILSSAALYTRESCFDVGNRIFNRHVYNVRCIHKIIIIYIYVYYITYTSYDRQIFKMCVEKKSKIKFVI